MLVQLQPNVESCLVTAFAMCMNLPVHILIKKIGRIDDRKIGFNVQEIIQATCDRTMIVEHCDCVEVDGVLLELESINDRLQCIPITVDLVLAYTRANGEGHVIVWDQIEKRAIDPASGTDADGDTIDECFDNLDYIWEVNIRKGRHFEDWINDDLRQKNSAREF